MEVLLFDKQKYDLLYNCSFYDIDKIPVESRRHPYWGVFFLSLYSTCFFLYIVCMIAMLTMEQRKQASYQFMILLGCSHLIGLQTSGLMVGIGTLKGIVFCSPNASNIVYFAGCTATGAWIASTSTSQILGINRCFVLYKRHLAETIFGGWRIILWMCIPLLLAFYMFTFTVPPIFTSILMSYLYNPHFGYFQDLGERYKSVPHATNNLFVCCTESLIYAMLIFLYLRATRSASNEVRTAVYRDKRIYIQVVLVGMIHFTASLSYVLIQFSEFFQNEYFIVITSTFYLLSQGAPPLIYISVNPTLRSQILCVCLMAKTMVTCGRTPSLENRITPSIQTTSGVRHSFNSATL
ncbi:hypothetical protein M3Y95_01023200 [Aphelenchoides besseyi]|nr:hypothetical protein M3Y95_01023200 [Aphelenchoides besseyi]